jgi:NAD(P)-dependent dehydrogenase (short-subunit alcohol dehydrogenase family)
MDGRAMSLPREEGPVSAPDFRLDDRVAVVTGASRGIGRAIALGLAAAGAHLVLAARRAPDLEAGAAEIRRLGRRALVVPAHLGRPPDIDRLFDETERAFGRIDILVNNAATNPVFGPLVDVEPAAWDRILALNVTGYLLAAQRAARAMLAAGRGAIVNVASTAGLRASAGIGAYSVSKAAVIMLTRVLARELAPGGVRVNAIAPALVETRFSEALWKTPEILETYLRATPMGRTGRAEEMAGAAVYLCSDAASYVTGQTLVLDGGHLA